MFRRLLSYFFPITIHSQPSAISQRLEVAYSNGALVLDSKHTTYSFGELQKILHHGLKNIPPSFFKELNSVLVLGVGAGSILHTLRKDFNYSGPITAVELDPDVIRLGNKYFHLDELDQIELLICDAFEYVLRCQKQFDLIVIDLFQDSQIPSFVHQEYFVNHLKSILNINGYILFNTIILNSECKIKNTEFYKQFPTPNYSVKRLQKNKSFNELLLIHANPPTAN